MPTTSLPTPEASQWRPSASLMPLSTCPSEMTPSDGARECHTLRLHLRSWRDTFQSDRVRHRAVQLVCVRHTSNVHFLGSGMCSLISVQRVQRTRGVLVSILSAFHLVENAHIGQCTRIAATPIQEEPVTSVTSTPSPRKNLGIEAKEEKISLNAHVVGRDTVDSAERGVTYPCVKNPKPVIDKRIQGRQERNRRRKAQVLQIQRRKRQTPGLK